MDTGSIRRKKKTRNDLYKEEDVMTGQEKERKISLLDLIWAVCLKWRSMLLCAIVFSILAGAISYYRSSQSVEASKAAIQNRQIPTLDAASQRKMTTYLQYRDSLQILDDYVANSYLMRLNPNDFYVGTLTYFVDNHAGETDAGTDNAVAIVGAYQSVLHDTAFLQEALGVDEAQAPYVTEAIDFDATDRFNTSGSNSQQSISDSAEHMLTIYAYADGEENCGKLLAKIQEKIDEQKSVIQKSLGVFELIPVASSINRKADNDLLSYQKINVERGNNYLQTITNMENVFSSAEKQYLAALDLEAELLEDSSKEEAIMQAKPAVGKKLMLVGFIMGILAAAVIACAGYLLNNHLMVEDSFEELYGVKLYSTILTKENSKKKWFSFLDSRIEKLRHMGRHYFAYEEAVEMAAANIRVYAKAHAISEIYVTGCAMEKKEEKIVQELQKGLNKSGVKLIAGKSVLYNAEALEKSVECGHVLLMESAGKSLYREIREEIEVCDRQNVKIMGTIVVQ
ncbi:MAG: hypothetical protein E7294_10980 [Lachnospiraceae bacterium]|jgi:hypothetical protein|nr:hypothetical protein [Lachnospiraceae bacterium]